MADLNKRELRRELVFTGTWGNAYKEHFSYSGDAAAGDKIYFGVIPKGSDITDFRYVQDGSGAAGATIDFGFEGVEDGAGTADYFAAGVALDSAGAGRTSVRPWYADKDLYIVGTVASAGVTGGLVDVIVERTFRGAQ